MSVEENKALVRALGDAMMRKDLTFMDAHPGFAQSKPFFEQLIAAFPDMQVTPQEVVAEGEWVAQRVMASGTMQGPVMGMAPTGKHATWEVMNMYRIVDGTIVASHGQGDVMGMMQQLGVTPPLAQALQ